MPEYSFSVRVLGLDLDNDDHVEQLLEAPFSIVPNQNGDEVELLVSVEAESDRQAWSIVNRFLQDKNPHIHIVRIDLDLVNVAEIAERCNVTRETARLWASGERRQGFPHSYTIAGQSKLWSWADVYSWLKQNNLQIADSYEDRPLDLAFIEVCNGMRARKGRRSDWWTGYARPTAANVITFTPSTASLPWPDAHSFKFKTKVDLDIPA